MRNLQRKAKQLDHHIEHDARVVIFHADFIDRSAEPIFFGRGLQLKACPSEASIEQALENYISDRGVFSREQLLPKINELLLDWKNL